jgi:hypothetical protein
VIVFHHVHQGSDAHVGMRVEAKMPEAASLVGQHRIDGRIVEEQHAPRRVALVVLVDGVDQRRRGGRRVALHHDARTVVDGSAQCRERLFVLPFAVVAIELQHPCTAGQRNAATCIDALDRPQKIAKHGFAGVGEGTAKALDQRNADRRRRLRARQRHGRQQRRRA